MSTESKNKWRRLHELVLKAKEAKDFETLGAVVEELAELKTSEIDAAKLRNGQYFDAVSKAYITAWKKLDQWQENPPPIAPQETQIGPGNPFPIPPPPPPPTVAAPTPQAPGSLDALKAKILDETVKCYNVPANDAAKAVNLLYTFIVKAFDEHAAQNARAIEEAAEPVKTPEPWTVDRLKLIFDEHDTIFDLDDDVADLIVSIFNDENNKRGKNMGYSTHAAKFPELWTGEELYFQACKELARTLDPRWAALNPQQKHIWLNAAKAANERMGSAPSPLKPWTAEEFYVQVGQPMGRVGIVTSVRLGAAQREACEKAAAVINKWAGLDS